MIATKVYKLKKDATVEQLRAAGLGDHYANHDQVLFYHNAAGIPWTASYIAAKGDPIANSFLRNLRPVRAKVFCMSLFISFVEV